MKNRRFLYPAIGLLVLFGMGQTPLSLHDSGIEFPDGSIQTTAALGFESTARTGLNGRCYDVLDAGSGTASCSALTVPTGKILVLEAISLRLTKIPDQDIRAILHEWSTHTGSDSLHWIFYEQIGTSGATGIFETTKLMRMYFQAGRQVRLELLRDSTTGNVGFDFAISGYLVDANP